MSGVLQLLFTGAADLCDCGVCVGDFIGSGAVREKTSGLALRSFWGVSMNSQLLLSCREESDGEEVNEK